MATYQYKILEFKPGAKVEASFNELGKEGWELVSVTPIGLDIKGDYDASFGGVGNGQTEGKFNKIAAYFKIAL